MLFSSQIFMYCFLPALLLLYFPCRKTAWRNAVLLAFSLLFYGWGKPVNLLLMFGVVGVNYIAGRLMGATRKTGARKLYLLAAVALSLSALGFFKYAGFFTEIVNWIPGVNLPVPRIELPLGISFFTFQALTYSVDVYRRDVQSQRSFFKVLLYVSLFPQLVAGPIVQYADVDAQLDCHPSSAEEICDGVFRFAVGLGRKVLLADTCYTAAQYFLNAEASSRTVLGAWMGMIFFAMQIYYDFSGYSDMAIGLGHIFGFTFRENFDYPYMSLSATEFWRRWHISLGTFFREYVYIPLGGNRTHPIRNLFVVWFLTGLWHGASWNFVIWGLYYGVLIFIERKALFPLYKKIGALPSRIFQVVYMFFVTVIGWTIFYFEDGLSFARHIGELFGAGGLPFTSVTHSAYLRGHIFLLGAAVLLAFPLVPKLLRRINGICATENGQYVMRRVAQMVFIVAVTFFSTARLVGNTYSPFIYSNF